jgi:uncharacterized membrane protein
MNLEFKKELPVIGIVLIPFIYLATIWNSLPERVPTHWDSNGEIDGWGSKFSLIGLLFMLPVLTYILMLIIPKIDPKKRISLMGGKLYQLKFFLVLFMSLLAMFIVFISKNQSVSFPNIIFILIGILYMVLGNYFKVIQPNYFMGFRTPWTLENQQVWKATHAFAGKLWFIGGFIIVLASLIFENSFFMKTFIGITIIIVLIPVIYSYIKFKMLQVKNDNFN